MLDFPEKNILWINSWFEVLFIYLSGLKECTHRAWKIIVTSILWLEEKFKFLERSTSLRRNTLWINSWFEEVLFIYLSGLKDYRYINFMVGRKIQISGTLDFSEKKHILIPGLKKFFSFISLVWRIIVTSILWLEEKFKFLNFPEERKKKRKRKTIYVTWRIWTWINSFWFEEGLRSFSWRNLKSVEWVWNDITPRLKGWKGLEFKEKGAKRIERRQRVENFFRMSDFGTGSTWPKLETREAR